MSAGERRDAMGGQVLPFRGSPRKTRDSERRRIAATLRSCLEYVAEAGHVSFPQTAEMVGAALLLLDEEAAK
jgi:hypothetical protein